MNIRQIGWSAVRVLQTVLTHTGERQMKKLVSKWLPLGLASTLIWSHPAAAAALPGAAATPAPAAAPAAASADTPSTTTAQPVTTSAVVVPAIAAPAIVRDEFTVKTSILLQSDARVYSGDPQQPTPDQFAFRRIQPGASGTFQKFFGFRVLTDFAGNRFNLLDASIDFSAVPYAKLRVGKFKSPFGLEVLQGSGALVLAERAFPSSLAPGYDTGVQLFGDLGGVVSYAVALVDGAVDGADADGDIGNSKDGVARLFVKPFARTRSPLKGLGLGAAASFGRTAGNASSAELPSFRTEGRNTFFRYASATDASGRLDLTKTAIADGRHSRWGVQGNYYVGPLGLQAEYVESTQRVRLADARATPTNRAWQVAASYVLVGGNASYAGVTPTASFDPAAGRWGALELAGRYGELVVDDVLFEGETFAKSTASARRARLASGGANWYLNKSVRFGAEYARTTFEDGAKDAAGLAVDRETEQVFITRFQVAL
jgi:phosphate-selective porin OprO/OprP